MRIISGSAGGLRLQVPASVTRPTSDRVREALFSTLGSRVAGSRVADLFAGSGALGIEALSRGAAAVTFVEQDRRAAAVIRDNLARCRLDGPQARVEVAGVRRWLRRLGAAAQVARGGGRPAGTLFDLVLADPPYVKRPGDSDHAADLLAAAELPDLLSPDGLLVVEVGAGWRPPPVGPSWRWRLEDDRSYGGTRLLYWRPRPVTGSGGGSDAEG